MMMAAAAKKDQADNEPSGNGHPASAKMEKGPHGKMPAGMKEAMKKMGANMDPEKRWKWPNQWVPVRKL